MSDAKGIRSIAASLALSLALVLAPRGFAQSSSSSTSGTPASGTAATTSTPAASPQQAPPATNAPATSDQQPPAEATTAPPEEQPAAATPQDAKKYPHDGGEDDVNAVGNRNIGGRGLGNWYSVEHEIAMGKAYAQQIEATVRLVKDPVVNEYINRIGQNLARNSDAKVPFTIKVIDTDTINAASLPGGFLYVNSGLILAADNESELAGAMAHEIAHVAAHHVARQMTRGEWANFLSLPLIFMGGGIGYAARSVASLGIPLTFQKFQRGFEAQADYLGVEYMYKAGYDPEGMVSMMEKLAALEKKKPGLIEKAFESHPATPERVKASEHEIATILPPRESYILDTSEFEDVKARLAAIENRHKIEDRKDKNRPTLRRASAQQPDAKGQPQPDDRPVLKRRDDNPNNN